MRIRSLAIVFLTLGIAGAAQAQRYYGGEPGIHRYGLVTGFSIGGGDLGLSDCSGCGSWGVLTLQGEIGGMVAPNVAILFDYTGNFHDFGGGDTMSNHIIDGAIRFFFARIFWIEGGLGIGELNFNFSDGSFDTSGWGLAGLGAFGIEVLQTPRFALDLSARIAGERISTDPSQSVVSFNLLVGFHWY
jgi:hypothetical protein